MIPRERKPQAQTSRLFLRTKDHRDCIYNDTYTNAIVMKVDGQDKIVWARYPQKCSIGFLNSGAYIGQHDFDYAIGHFDTAILGQRSGTMIQLDDIVIYINAYTTSSVWVTKDGLTWKQAKYNGSFDTPLNPNMRRIGKRSIGSWSHSYNYTQTVVLYCTSYTFEEDEQGEWNIVRNSNSVTVYDSTNRAPSWIGHTRHGALVLRQSTAGDDKIRVYECNADGDFTFKSELAKPTLYDESGDITDLRYFTVTHEDTTAFIYVGMKRGPGSEYAQGSCIYNICVYSTSNYGLTWELSQLFSYGGIWYSRVRSIPSDIFYRDGFYHVIAFDGGGNMHHHKSADCVTWEEVTHAPYQDIELVSGCGAMYEPEPTTFQVRLHYTDDASYNSDLYPNIRMKNCVYGPENMGFGNRAYTHLDKGYFNMYFEYGEPTEDTGICFECSGYLIYFEEPFVNTEKSYAVKLRSYVTAEQAEPLKQGDYCL